MGLRNCRSRLSGRHTRWQRNNDHQRGARDGHTHRKLLIIRKCLPFVLKFYLSCIVVPGTVVVPRREKKEYSRPPIVPFTDALTRDTLFWWNTVVGQITCSKSNTISLNAAETNCGFNTRAYMNFALGLISDTHYQEKLIKTYLPSRG